MKIITFAVIVLLLISACKKSATNATNTGDSAMVISMHISDPGYHEYTIDSFLRDENNRLIKFIKVAIDSTSLPVQRRSIEYVFTFSGNDSLPISYNVTPSNELHLLRYDGQKRIVMDSSTFDRNTFYFYYSSSGAALNLDLPHSIGHYTDTVAFTNENVTERRYWFFAPTYTLRHYINNTYSSLINPIRFPGNIGFLLFDISGKQDYLSKNLISQSVNNSHVDFTASWSTDEKGKVINGSVEMATISGENYKQIITFKYR